MKLLGHSAAAGLSLLGALPPTPTDTAFDFPGIFNPIVPGYFANPTVEKFGDIYTCEPAPPASVGRACLAHEGDPNPDRWRSARTRISQRPGRYSFASP